MKLKTLGTLAVVLGLIGVSRVHAVGPHGTWTTGGSVGDSHTLGAAALLGNGKVIAAGGLNGIGQGTSSANLYDPSTNSWSSASNMGSSRWSFDAITLSDGNALFAGGSNAIFNLFGSGFVRSDAEVYDQNTNSFFSTANNLSVARHGYGISALNDGRVLITGGSTAFGSLGGAGVTAVDIYDPVTNLFTAAASLNAGRSLQAQTTLGNGKVVVVGGAQNNAEVYDPVANTWASSINNMGGTLKDMKAFELYNGKVFIAAGQNTSTAATTDATWFFDPDTLMFSAGPSMAGFNKANGVVQTGTSDYSAFDLFEGTAMEGRYILFAGGEFDPGDGSGDVELNSSSIYDAVNEIFIDAGDMPFTHDDHAESVLLNDGNGNPRMLLFGGNSTSSGTSLFTFDLTTIASPGDFDGNMNVDGADFLAWQRGESPSPLSSTDLATWEANYGTTGGTLAAAFAAVPEPSTGVLLVGAALLAMASRRRNRH